MNQNDFNEPFDHPSDAKPCYSLSRGLFPEPDEFSLAESDCIEDFIGACWDQYITAILAHPDESFLDEHFVALSNTVEVSFIRINLSKFLTKAHAVAVQLNHPVADQIENDWHLQDDPHDIFFNAHISIPTLTILLNDLMNMTCWPHVRWLQFLDTDEGFEITTDAAALRDIGNTYLEPLSQLGIPKTGITAAVHAEGSFWVTPFNFDNPPLTPFIQLPVWT